MSNDNQDWRKNMPDVIKAQIDSSQQRPMSEKVQEYLEEMETSSLVLDGFEEAICGVIENDENIHVVYNRRKCIDLLVNRDGMSYEEAEDYFSYNTLRAIPYMKSQGVIPFIMDDLEYR